MCWQLEFELERCMLDAGQGDGCMRPRLCMLLYLWVAKVPIHRKAVLDRTRQCQARAGAVQLPIHLAIETTKSYKDPNPRCTSNIPQMVWYTFLQ